MPDPDVDRVRSMMHERDQTARELPDPVELQGGVTFGALDPDGEDRFQRLRRELGLTAFGLNLIRLRPRQRGRIHRHEYQEEVYLVLEGTLTLEIEREPHELPRGALARVAPGIRRRLVNAGAEPLAVLAIGGAMPHEGRDATAFTSWEEDVGAPPQDVPLPPDLDP